MEKLIDKSFLGKEYKAVGRKGSLWDKGTLFFPDETLIPDYPRMPRIQWLQSGIERHYQSHFWVEEKVDGYNVRVFLQGSQLMAVTRSGNVCPFSLDKLNKNAAVKALLSCRPELIICAEMGGLGNPYNYSHYNLHQDETFFYIFDLMYKNKAYQFVPVRERYALEEEFGLSSRLCLGRFHPSEQGFLNELIRYADISNKEGLIFKPENPQEPVLKYVTFKSVINDVRAMNPLVFEEQPEFFHNRIKRGTYFLAEQGLNQDLHDWFDFETGVKAIREVEKEGHTYQTVETYFYDELMAECFLDLLKEMQIHIFDIQKKAGAEKKIIYIKFKKELMRSSDIIKYDWSGNHRID